jgi:hypothetical protein
VARNSGTRNRVPRERRQRDGDIVKKGKEMRDRK